MFPTAFPARIVADPVLRTVGDGTRQVCNLRVAVDTQAKDDDGTYHSEFCDVAIWGPRGKFVADNFAKGDGIMINGHILRTRLFSRKNGEPGASIEIEADNAGFLPRGPQTSESSVSDDSDDAPPF